MVRTHEVRIPQSPKMEEGRSIHLATLSGDSLGEFAELFTQYNIKRLSMHYHCAILHNKHY